jgi:hypothetical protein
LAVGVPHLGPSALVLCTKALALVLVLLLGSWCFFGAAPHKPFGLFFFGKFSIAIFVAQSMSCTLLTHLLPHLPVDCCFATASTL